MQSEEVALVMHVLHTRQGWSIAELAREFDVNWRTARRYAKSPQPPVYGPRPKPAELSASQLAYVRRRLEECEGIRATTLLRELRERGYEGSYPSLVRRVRVLRDPSRETDPVVRFETDAGVQVQLDWADCGRWLVGDRLVDLYALVAVLGFSRMVAVRFATDKTRPTTLRLVVELLHDLGGAPGEILTDRDPVFVIGSLSDGRAVFAPEWIDLTRTLEVAPKACKPYRAQTKGKVERVVRELKEDFLCWLTGQLLPARPTVETYDAFARRWCVETLAPRRHKTTRRIVGEAWERERDLLRPIPTRILHAATGSASAHLTSGTHHPRGARSAPLRTTEGVVRGPSPIIRAQEAGSTVELRPLDDYEAAGR